MRRLEILDYGRFLAAFSVLLFHYTFNGIANGKVASMTHITAISDWTKYGYLGVEFFFMISGYVIFFSASARSASQFAVSRALRLYPAFWAAVLFTASFAHFWGGERMSVTGIQVIGNLTMVPTLIGFRYVDGVYWTLFYELSFYFAVFVLLLAGAQRHLDRIFIAWPFIMVASLALGASSLPYLGGYYAYFAAGALFAITNEHRNHRGWVPLALVVSFGLCLAYSVENAHGTTDPTVEYSSRVIIGIISVYFGFFWTLRWKAPSRLVLPHSALLGALTYPLYLVHAHFGYMLLDRFGTDEYAAPTYLGVTLASLFAAYLIHAVVEKGLSGFWKKAFDASVGRTARFAEAALAAAGRERKES